MDDSRTSRRPPRYIAMCFQVYYCVLLARETHLEEKTDGHAEIHECNGLRGRMAGRRPNGKHSICHAWGQKYLKRVLRACAIRACIRRA